MRKHIVGALISAVAVFATLAPAAIAATATVTSQDNSHTLNLTAETSETNTVSVAFQAGGPPDYAISYSLTDSTAPLVAGSGCSGGGEPGSTVTCELPHPRSPCFVRGCPGLPAVYSSLVIDVGDFDDSVDTTQLAGSPVSVRLLGGEGADLLTDGGGGAILVPGDGPDRVLAGTGFDYIEASTGAPDEPDVFEFAPGSEGTVRYSAATYPVSVSLDDLANDGAAGEGDQVIGTPNLIGGLADDVLLGSGDPSVRDDLDGLGGDDLIRGGEGDDQLSGGSGNDLVIGNAGDDRGYGDGIVGGLEGEDDMRGGPGSDEFQGDGGRDRIAGGAGSDFLLGANGAGPDHERDSVDCGPGRDRRAWVDPEDRVRRCERVRTQGA